MMIINDDNGSATNNTNNDTNESARAEVLVLTIWIPHVGLRPGGARGRAPLARGDAPAVPQAAGGLRESF